MIEGLRAVRRFPRRNDCDVFEWPILQSLRWVIRQHRPQDIYVADLLRAAGHLRLDVRIICVSSYYRDSFTSRAMLSSKQSI
jgi:hypothetical protein